MANEIRTRTKAELGYTVNIGISNNKLLAKMASELEKPDKIHTLFPHEIAEKMWPLDISELFMVGRHTSAELKITRDYDHRTACRNKPGFSDPPF